jgi:hypothetical protein
MVLKHIILLVRPLISFDDIKVCWCLHLWHRVALFLTVC